MTPSLYRQSSLSWPGSFRAAAAMTAALFACLAPPSTAQVRIGGDSHGYYTVAVKSWWELPFRTVVRQRYDFSCGSAAVATLLTYHYGRPTDERAPFAAMWKDGDQGAIRKSGFSMLDMKNYLTGIGLQAEGFRFTIDQLRQVRRPAIVLLNLKGFKHFVVIKGISNGMVLTGDPMLGLRKYSTTEFAKIWNGILLAIVATDDRHAPLFNLTSEWDAWPAKSPIEQGVMRDAVAHLTDNLPPIYQLIPQILVDVRTGGLSTP